MKHPPSQHNNIKRDKIPFKKQNSVSGVRIVYNSSSNINIINASLTPNQCLQCVMSPLMHAEIPQTEQ